MWSVADGVRGNSIGMFASPVRKWLVAVRCVGVAWCELSSGCIELRARCAWPDEVVYTVVRHLCAEGHNSRSRKRRSERCSPGGEAIIASMSSRSQPKDLRCDGSENKLGACKFLPMRWCGFKLVVGRSDGPSEMWCPDEFLF
jgi:hypothetical protein